MDIRGLEYLLVIAQEKNLSKAAERLYISQPALSRFLQKQESDVGIPLFERKKKQLIPTAAGEIYLETARKMIHLQQDLEKKLKKLQESPHGKLRIGITPGRARTLLPKILPLFQQSFPEYELNILEEDAATLEHALEAGSIELCFLTMTEADRLSKKRHQYELIAQEEIVLCAPRSSNYELLAEERCGRTWPWIDLKHLENDCFILLKPQMRIGQASRRILEAHAISPKTVELSNIDTALTLVAQRYGVTFSTSYRLDEHETVRNCSVFTFGEQRVAWDFVVAYDKDTELTAPAKYLIELTRSQY